MQCNNSITFFRTCLNMELISELPKNKNNTVAENLERMVTQFLRNFDNILANKSYL